METVGIDAALDAVKTVFVFTDGRIVVAAVDQVEAPDLAMEFISVCLTNEEAGIVFGRGKADAGRDKKGTFLDLVLLPNFAGHLVMQCPNDAGDTGDLLDVRQLNFVVAFSVPTETHLHWHKNSSVYLYFSPYLRHIV